MDYAHHAKVVFLQHLSIEKGLSYFGDTSAVEIFSLSFTNVGIDDVRKITLAAAIRPDKGDTRLIVVCAKSINFEAQQALLKILEEPPASTKFLLILPLGANLLPTVLSRLSVLARETGEDTLPVEFVEFETLSYADRLALVANKMLKKDVEWTHAMGSGLKVYLKEAKNKLPLSTLKTLTFITEELSGRGASNKMLLEELSLSLPISAEK